MRRTLTAGMATTALLALLAPAIPAAAQPAASPLPFAENFDSLSSQLQPRVDETTIPEDLLGWTDSAPAGWTVTNLPSIEDAGKTEWRGWTFATPEFWAAAQSAQGRENFTKASGVLAVADNDEWADASDVPGSGDTTLWESTLTSPTITVSGKTQVHVNFDSSYRQTQEQVGALDVRFDGGETVRLFEWSTESLGDQTYLENKTVTVPVEVPAGATSMELDFVIEDAHNDWYWAFDNLSVDDAPREGAEGPMPPPPPSPSDVPDGISTNKSLFIDFDGVRLDELRNYHTPNIDALIERGSFGVSYMHDNALGPTVSGNGHSNMLTGVWSDKHSVEDNTFTDINIEQYPSYLDRLETANPDFSTFSTLDWTPINTYIIDAPDVKLQQTGAGTKITDQMSTDAAVEALTTRNPDALYVYLHDGDAVGHCCTAESVEYKLAIENLDRRVGELVRAVEARETYSEEDWLIIASTDHGFTGTGHGGDQHATRKVWTLAAGGDIPAGPADREYRQVDVAATILDHMGVEAQPEWDLDGIPIGTPSTDPFDTVKDELGPVVDEPAKNPDAGGWTKQTPEGWSIDEQTEGGVTEYRGWSFASGEFWTTSQEGEGRGSFVRGRDVVAVADPDEWSDAGDPAGAFDSTLWSPWQRVDAGADIDLSFVSHYRQHADSTQHAQVVAEFDDGTRTVLWERGADAGARFDISAVEELTTTAPEGATQVRIGWSLTTESPETAGYWGVDAPEIHTGYTGAPEEPGEPGQPEEPQVPGTGSLGSLGMFSSNGASTSPGSPDALGTLSAFGVTRP
ncbi:alkaline phosphatase family protein [Dietzia sp. E1]|uniref:alkaline phosphatase family protein n=1 Tax=Dietzia sp. E1 TaxID=328361 RepID=UPI0015F94D9B|nr:alkaline phosphatase family protein [Dietzia sp. E1]MBB1020755.1 alkaline phosphatase family protein [Dietzia sp. E1]